MMVQDVLIRPVTLTGADDLRFTPFGACFALQPTSGRFPVPLTFEGESSAGTGTLTIITVPSARGMNGVRRIECHPFSVQAFVPLTSGPVVTIVAPAGKPPTHAEQLSGFVVPAGHGIAYRTGIWHSGLMGFEEDTSVVTFVRRIDEGSDTDFAELSFNLYIAEHI
jgi:ureidoglycolate hydrolase